MTQADAELIFAWIIVRHGDPTSERPAVVVLAQCHDCDDCQHNRDGNPHGRRNDHSEQQ